MGTSLNDFSVEELRDLMLFLSPAYVTSFKNEGLMTYRKLYNVVRAALKSKVSESEYATIVEDVISATKRVANMTNEEIADINKTNFDDMRSAAVNL